MATLADTHVNRPIFHYFDTFQQGISETSLGLLLRGGAAKVVE